MNKKVVLAYSGGLDTSCSVAWLKEHGYKVVCFSANLGSEFSPVDIRKKARQSGVSAVYVKDLRKEFARDYILPALKAGAIYQGKYVLSTALGRPLIAKYLVDIAHKEGASYVAHGCTAKGNDQVRLDAGVKTLNPRLKIIAPLRLWGLDSRGAEVAYARKKKIPVAATTEKIYSIDKNIWGVSIEAGPLERLSNEPKDEAFIVTQSPLKAPDKPQAVTIWFDKGAPVRLNGRKMELVALIEQLNAIGGRHAIGRTDVIEDRTVGIKSRELYEAPAAWILHTAHRELEALTLHRETLWFKEIVALKYAQLAYQGLWFSHIKQSLDSFVNATQNMVSGEITLKLYKGNIIVCKRKSPLSLYKETLATYGGKDTFNKNWSEGFINIWSMPFIRNPK